MQHNLEKKIMKNILKFSLSSLVLGLVLVGGFTYSIFKAKAANPDITIDSAVITSSSTVLVTLNSVSVGGDDLFAVNRPKWHIDVNDGGVTPLTPSAAVITNATGPYTITLTFAGTPFSDTATAFDAAHGLYVDALGVTDAALDTNLPVADAASTPITDGQSPVISATAPAASAHINTETVSYTLSEAVASAAIVFTETAPGAAVHTCTLQGTALTTGAHNGLALATDANACVAWAAPLVDGSTYTVTFDATDAATNAATTVTNTGVVFDITPPTFTMQYYTDSGLTLAVADDAKLKAGTYYIKITANESLNATPTVSIDAEGTNNDVVGGATTSVGGDDYKYTETIVSDVLAVGTVRAAVTVTGTDTATNTATAVAPTNFATKEIYTDTTAPTTTILSIDSLSADTGTSSSDFITKTAAQTISGTLSAPLAGDEILNGSVNAGVSYTDITGMVSGTAITWTGATLGAGTSSIKFKVTDAAGNDSSVTEQAYTLDIVAPTVASADITTVDGSYNAGDDIDITVNYLENVNITGLPRIQLNVIGDATRYATYLSGTGTTAIVFRYTVAAHDNASDLGAASVGALGLNGGAIKDIADNDAVNTLPNDLTAANAVVVDTVAPSAPTIGAFTATGGTVVPGYINPTNTGFTVKFTTPSSNFLGTAHLYVGGVLLGTDVTIFVAAGDTEYTLTGDATSITDLGGDGVKVFTVKIIDAAGNIGTASGSVSATLDTTKPQVTSVAVSSGSTVDVQFNEAMDPTDVLTASNYTVSGSGIGTFAANPNSITDQGGNLYRLTWTSGEMFDGGNITITVAGTASDLALNLVDVGFASETHASGAIGVAPQVVSVAVNSGSTVDVQFNEAMDPTDVLTASNYTVSGSGIGTFAANPDTVTDQGGNLYRLTWLSGEMFNGGDITITVAGTASDLALNLVDPVFNFGTHSGGAIGVAPQVVSVAVVDGSNVDVTFNEPMEAISATTASNYTVSGSGIGTFAANPDSVAPSGPNTYRLTWSTGEMFNGGNITVTVANATDSALNVIDPGFNFGTHLGGAIGVAPVVDITSPLTTEKKNASAIITFTNDSDTTPFDGECSVDNLAWTLCTTGITTLGDIPQFAGLVQGAFTLYLRDADAAGNSGTDNEAGIVNDTIAPQVTSVSVTSGSTVDVVFNEAMDPTDVLTALNYTVSGTGIGTLNANPDSIAPALGPNTYTLTWLSGEMFNGGDITITVAGTASDLALNLVDVGFASATHTSGAIGVAPQVVSTTVMTGSTVDVAFNEPMETVGATTAVNYTVSGTGIGTFTANPDSVADLGGNVYELTWNTGEMFNGGDITITVANATDLALNVIDPLFNSATALAGAIGVAPTAPTSVSVTPVGGTIVTDTLNGTNTNMTATATIVAGEATGGTAELLVGGVSFTTPILQAGPIGGGDTSVNFDLGTGTTAALQLAILAAEGGTISVRLTDAAGNSTDSSVGNPTLVVDYSAPTANFAAPVDNVGSVTGALSSGDKTDDTSLALSGTNELGSTVEVRNGLISLGAATVVGTGWTFSATIADGPTYLFNVKETDSAGNVSAATSNFTVIGDMTAPTILIGSDKASLSSGQTAAITFTLSEASTNFIVGDVTVAGGSLSSFAGSGTSYTATFTPTNSSTTPGTLDVDAAKFTDSAGNNNTAATQLSMTVNTVASSGGGGSVYIAPKPTLIPTVPTECPVGALYSTVTGQRCTTTTTEVVACPVGALYSTITGQRCTAPDITVVTCPAGFLFSTVTGQRCTTTTTLTTNLTPNLNPSPTDVFTLPLTLGSSNPQVTALQILLTKLGLYTGPVTGSYFNLTQAAVKAFQEKYNIAHPGDDGYGNVGPKTRATLNSLNHLFL